MRVLVVIAVLVGATFMILLVLTDLARELSRHSHHAPPDLDGSDDWDVALDEFEDTAKPTRLLRASARFPTVVGRRTGAGIRG
jgi:hypothetical protein